MADSPIIQQGGTFDSIAGPFRLLFSVQHRYANRLDQQRAQAVIVMTLVLSVIGLAAAFGLAFAFPQRYPIGQIVPPVAVVAAVCLVCNLLARRGNLQLASAGFVLSLAGLATIEMIPYGLIGPGMFSFTLPVITAALLMRPVWGFAAILPSVAGVGIVSYIYNFQTNAETITPEAAQEAFSANLVLATVFLIVLAVIVGALVYSLQRHAEEADRRANQLEVAAAVSETAGQASSVSELLNLAVERIREIFGFYHAQVFLLDQEHRMARLEASTGRAGVALLARGHALPVGSRSVIGQTTYGGKPVTVNDVRTNPVHRPNELLPDTRAELAVPLLVGGEVIGALDVQNTVPNAFRDEDIRSLQIIANQLATFIEKNRLVSELATRAEENQRLFEETQGHLRQIEELNRRLTREGWSEYLRTHRTRGALGFTLHSGDVDRDTAWTAPMRQAFQGEHSVVIRQDQHAHIAAIPLRIRGEVIGVLEIERGGGQPWTENDVELAETLVERLALAVENARLYEQATLTAEREQVVNRIAQEVQEAASVDEVLQAALTELSEVLGAARGVVQISTKEESAPGGQTSG